MGRGFVRGMGSVQRERANRLAAEIAAVLERLDGKPVDIHVTGDECHVDLSFLVPDGPRKRPFPVCDEKAKRAFAAGDIQLVNARFPLDPPESALRWSAYVRLYRGLSVTSGRVPSPSLRHAIFDPAFLLKDVDRGEIPWADWAKKLETRLKTRIKKVKRADLACLVDFEPDRGGQGPRFVSQGMG